MNIMDLFREFLGVAASLRRSSPKQVSFSSRFLEEAVVDYTPPPPPRAYSSAHCNSRVRESADAAS